MADTTFIAGKNRQVQGMLLKYSLMMMTLVTLMWIINVTPFLPKGLNFVFFFGGTVLILVFGLSPMTIALSSGIGGGMGWLRDRDVSKSVAEGIDFHFGKMLSGALFGLHVLTGFLATMPFESAPWSFWGLAAACMTIISTLWLYSIPGRWLPWIVISYSLAVITIVFGQIFWNEAGSTVKNTWRDLTAMTGGTPVVKTSVPWQDVEVPASKAVKVPIYGYHYCVDNEDADGVFATVKAVGVGTRSAHLIIRSTTGKKETVGLVKLNRKVSKERFELPKGCEALYL